MADLGFRVRSPCPWLIVYKPLLARSPCTEPALMTEAAPLISGPPRSLPPVFSLPLHLSPAPGLLFPPPLYEYLVSVCLSVSPSFPSAPVSSQHPPWGPGLSVSHLSLRWLLSHHVTPGGSDPGLLAPRLVLSTSEKACARLPSVLPQTLTPTNIAGLAWTRRVTVTSSGPLQSQGWVVP